MDEFDEGYDTLFYDMMNDMGDEFRRCVRMYVSQSTYRSL
jgi:hypothetical protein